MKITRKSISNWIRCKSDKAIMKVGSSIVIRPLSSGLAIGIKAADARVASVSRLLVFFVLNLMFDRGYNIGTRLIEDFLARTSIPRCNDFRETAEVISKVSRLNIRLLESLHLIGQ